MCEQERKTDREMSSAGWLASNKLKEEKQELYCGSSERFKKDLKVNGVWVHLQGNSWEEALSMPCEDFLTYCGSSVSCAYG